MYPAGADERLLRRFYEPLVLLGVLDPTRGAHRPDLVAERGLDEPSKLWRNFLDQLSWLCDSSPGGDTVTSVAAQKNIDHPCFWMASNSTARQRAQDHLEWLFGCLTPLYTATAVSTAQIEDQIFIRCVHFSSKRVKTYTAWLLQAIRGARRAMRVETTSEDTLLLSELQKFESVAHDPVQLCRFAYSARRHDFMPVLNRRHHAHSSRGVWSDLRHYIGRLGCWTKAVRVVCQGARRFPQHIENAQFRVVEPYGPVDLPNKRHLTDLVGVVRRMLPAHEKELIERLNQALQDVESVAQVNQRFREDYSSVRPRPHAELLILEHFYWNDFEFVADDRYIGCSKPSCYCCHVYMQLHTGGFTPRPCHGNLWINWAPPIPLAFIDPTDPSVSRVQERHTFQILQKMLPRIRQDLQEQILSKQPKRQKLPDSTTGMSSVFWVSDVTEAVRNGRADDLIASASAVVDEPVLIALGNGAILESENVLKYRNEGIQDRDFDRTTGPRDLKSIVSPSDFLTAPCSETRSGDEEGTDEDILLFHGRHAS